MSWILPMLAGAVCGVISGYGVGGGTLLMVWMTAAASMEQRAAQGINLLYFLPTAGASMIFHLKNRLIDWRAAVPAMIAGCIMAAASALAATAIDASLLKKLFGIFLILTGISELFKVKKK